MLPKDVAIKTPIIIHSNKVEIHRVNEFEKMIFGSQHVTPKSLARIVNNHPLLLVASQGDRPVGFKLGYVIPDTRTWFSWLGGVHPNYRKRGIAQQLLNLQEKHAKILGLEKIYFTTFDRFTAMINLGEKNGYQLIRSELDNGEMKYWYGKSLLKNQ
ncbi:MAG: GNAT family N-acetyltransferase [Candidatus Marinimicrobia bacterium]|nr:GNAT family N-acetyltransferase [Candidatus Neomarinimicrobiota bacterium]